MEIFVIVWIIIIGINLVKAINKSKGSSGNSRRSFESKRYNQGMTRSSQAAKQMTAAMPSKVSWRNTAEISKADISFRGLREGEDELAYLIRKNTAYEKILEARLERR